jgi:hypothetical protein
MLTVIAFYWIDPARARNVVLTPQDVRIWRSMVQRNLTIPHQIKLVTHRPDLFEDFDCVPLDLAKHVPGTCLVKLQAHKIGGVAKEGERVWLMDIDLVVTGPLDPLVARDEPMVFFKNPNFEVGGKRGFIQGSLQLFTVGATEFLYSDFDPRRDMAWINRRFGGAEQCWISERLNTQYPLMGWEWDVPYWDESSGVYGAGRLFGGKMGNGVTTELPANARIVVTPGDRKATDPRTQEQHPWMRQYLT